MEELENRDDLDTEQETPQDSQEAPVTAEDAAGEETDAQEPEAPQEAAEGPETGTQEESTDASPEDAPVQDATEETGETIPQETTEEPADEAPQEEAPQDAQEAPVAAEATAGEETDTQEPETPQEAAEGPETSPQEEAGEDQPTEQAETGEGPSLGSGKLGLGSTLTPAVVTPTPTLLGANSGATEAEQESDEEYETLAVNELDVVKLGRQGEHLTQQVLIDCTDWLSKLPGCTLLIAAIRPTENTVYLPTVSVADGVITWDIQDQDTAKGGWGRGEVRAMKDGKIKKSAVFRTRVEPSLEGSGSAPATPPDWVQEILDSVAAAQEAAEQAAASAIQAAENTRGLAGWTLTKEDDDTVTIDYNEESEG